jgi:hypothetical protein
MGLPSIVTVVAPGAPLAPDGWVLELCVLVGPDVVVELVVDERVLALLLLPDAALLLWLSLLLLLLRISRKTTAATAPSKTTLRMVMTISAVRDDPEPWSGT